MNRSTLNDVLKKFDIVERVGQVCLELGGQPVTGLEAPTWELTTIYGPLYVTPELRGSVVCAFAQPARAYAKVVDVRYPSGQWIFNTRTRLSDASGPQEAVQLLSELVVRLTGRLKDITLRFNDRKTLTTIVVGETNGRMPRTPK